MSVHWFLLGLPPCLPPSHRPASPSPCFLCPPPDVQVRRNVTSALELAAQRGVSPYTPITLFLCFSLSPSLEEKVMKSSTQPVARYASRSVWSAALLLLFVPLLPSSGWQTHQWRFSHLECTSKGRISQCELSWEAPAEPTMSRRKQGKPLHLSKREFSRKWEYFASRFLF